MTISEQEVCDHMMATNKTHRCPSCEGIMRRCCQSTVGCHHREFCETLLQALARKGSVTAFAR